MSAKDIHTILERLCNLLRVEARAQGASAGLLPIQLEALHYLSQCNRYSDTPQAVTEFLGQTKGTVSQSLKVLESRELIQKKADTNDRRVVHLKVTDTGHRMLASVVPARFLTTAWAALPTDVQDRLSDDLRELLRAAQQANKGRSFAACKTCHFNEKDTSGWRCGLTAEPLSEIEIEQLCREHEYAD